jgi:maleate isomerase
MSQSDEVIARIGLLVPPSNAVMEVDFYRSLPADITVHTTHIYRSTDVVSAESLAETAANAANAAKSLVQTEPALIVYGHTASSYMDRGAGDKRITESIGQAVGCPVLTTARAVVRCLRSVQAQRVAFVAPFPKAIASTGAEFLRAHGFEVPAVECMSIEQVRALKKVPMEALFELAVRAAAGADAVYVCGTGLNTRKLVGRLESELSKPVITANMASLWSALDHLGHADRFAFGESSLLRWQKARQGTRQ